MPTVSLLQFRLKTVQDQLFIQQGLFSFKMQGELFLIISLFQSPCEPSDALQITSSSEEQKEHGLTHMEDIMP